MPIIFGRYWNVVYENSPEVVLKDKVIMQNMRILAKNTYDKFYRLTYLLNNIKAVIILWQLFL